MRRQELFWTELRVGLSPDLGKTYLKPVELPHISL